jgi:hypothetical protein
MSASGQKATLQGDRHMSALKSDITWSSITAPLPVLQLLQQRAATARSGISPRPLA